MSALSEELENPLNIHRWRKLEGSDPGMSCALHVYTVCIIYVYYMYIVCILYILMDLSICTSCIMYAYLSLYTYFIIYPYIWPLFTYFYPLIFTPTYSTPIFTPIFLSLATYELIQKIQILQKRLILKTEENIEKSITIQSQNKLYINLQSLLASQPGPEIGQQIATLTRNIKSKNQQLKVLTSEVNMYQAQTYEYKYEVERLSRELIDLKRKYFLNKRRDEVVSLGQYTGSVPINNSGSGVASNTSNNSIQSYTNNTNTNNTLYSNNNTDVMSRSLPTSAMSGSGGGTGSKPKYAGGGFAIKQPYRG